MIFGIGKWIYSLGELDFNHLLPVLLEAGIEYFITVQTNFRFENKTPGSSKQYWSWHYVGCVGKVPSDGCYLVTAEFPSLVSVKDFLC